MTVLLSLKFTCLPSEPLPVHQEVQQVDTTVVAEGKESRGQGQSSSDSDDYLTPPSSPAANTVSDVSAQSKSLA